MADLSDTQVEPQYSEPQMNLKGSLLRDKFQMLGLKH